MKSAAFVLLSVVLAAIAYLLLYALSAVAILGQTWDSPHFVRGVIFAAILYVSAFLTGLFLTRVKPFSAPRATVPLGTMGFWIIGGFAGLAESRSAQVSVWEVAGFVGFVASIGLVSLLGCVVARKAERRLARFSVRWFQVIGPLAVLVCTAFVACALRIITVGYALEADIRQILTICRYGLFVVAALTIANLALIVARSRQSLEAG